MLTRRTSSLSIAMDYLAQNMHHVATEARKKSSEQSDLPMSIRANTIFMAIEKIFTKVWLCSRHLSLIISYFAVGKEKKTSTFGTYRVEVFVALFNRVTDPQNLDVVMKMLVRLNFTYITAYIF